MKILYTVFANGWGGLEKYPLTLKDGLEKRGNTLIILTIKDSKLHIESEKLGVKVYTINRFKKISFEIIKFLDKIVKEEKIDIVHLNTSRELYNWYFILKKYKSLKCFLTFHIGVPSHKGIIHKIIYKSLDGVFAISTREAEEMEKKLNIDKNKIFLLHNGVDIKKFNLNIISDFREKENISKDELIIVSIGNLSKPKGILEWLEVAKKIVCNYKNVTFIWVGDDSHIKEEYTLESLRKDIESKGFSNKIRLLGYRKDIASILKASNLFVLPAHKESFGIVYIEAMAMGLPVIGCNAGGVPDIITENNGWLCDPENVEALYKIICLAIEKDLSKYKEYNKKYVRNFSIEKHIEKLEGVYNGC